MNNLSLVELRGFYNYIQYKSTYVPIEYSYGYNQFYQHLK